MQKSFETIALMCILLVFSGPPPMQVQGGKSETLSPVYCAYAPPGEYMKDHTLVFHDGWWHLYAISGTEGYYHGFTGNEETISWSISKDLVNWEFRGHVLHASQRTGNFDQHEIWSPFCLKANGRFYLFYTGVVYPVRPMCYQRIGHDHKFNHRGRRETQGLAVSDDLTEWVKIAPPVEGLNVRGRDSNVVYDESGDRWLLYSTAPTTKTECRAYVSESKDLLNWHFLGVCARFPLPNKDQVWSTTESLVVMRHPRNNGWIMLGNFYYVLSDDPADFTKQSPKLYDLQSGGRRVDIGFAGEMIQHGEKWYRSGCFGGRDRWKLGFTEIKWDPEGAFHIVRPSVLASTF